MMSLIEIFTIIFIHWLADFVFQTHWQATNKSKNNLALTYHVTTYALTWILPMAILFCVGPYSTIGSLFAGLYFGMLTFMFHWVTDYYTSRLNSKLWAKGDVHNFFVSVGADQCLHYFQLFLTYYYIKTA